MTKTQPASSAPPAPSTPSTLYLIDGHAQFFRAYYAIRGGMTSPVTSEPTHLTYGFTGMLLKLMREMQPDYLAVAIDVGGDTETFRSQIYPEYKANRESAPDDFHPQVERCLELLERMGIPVLAAPGFEADDIMATVVRQMREEHPECAVRVISRDKDLTQFLGDNIEMFDIHKDEQVTPDKVFKTEGVRPEHVVDILTLMGDAVDNIPGVPGIGPKTAAKLILEYGSIENLYKHIEEIKGKKRENLEAAREQLEMTRQLIVLREDVETTFDLDKSRFDPRNLPVDDLAAAFRELGFNRFPDEVRKLAGETGEAGEMRGEGTESKHKEEGAGDGFGDDLFSQAAVHQSSSASGVEGNYKCIRTLDELDSLIEEIKQAGRFAVDTETDSLATVSANLCGISLSIAPGSGYYIPTLSPEPESHLTSEQVLDRLKPILEDSEPGGLLKIFHNLKFDSNIFRRHGVEIAGPVFDTMIASFVLDSTRTSHGMDHLALSLLNYTCTPIRDIIGKGKQQITFDQVSLDRATPYAAEDADITLRLYEHLHPLLDEPDHAGLQKLFTDTEMPLVPVLAAMEWNGIFVDGEELDRQRVHLQEQIDDLRQTIINAAPHSFNPDSPKQLALVLFNKPDQEPPGLGLPVQKKGKTGPSTDVEVLEKLAANPKVESSIPSQMVEYRQFTKLVNTYLMALKEAINPETHRIHCSFHQTGASTGRLSSSDPNLQNIPIRTEVGREIRRAFRAKPSHVLLTADYSQIELRILAHLSEDAGLIRAFEQGEDIHRAVAAEVFGVTPEEVTSEQRGSAKMVNFGIIYGITQWGLARRLGPDTTVEIAEKIITDYKAQFPGINEFLDRCIQQAETQGYVETMLGRRRAVPQIHARHPQQRALGERLAINTVVQGSAADLIKLAMIDIHGSLPSKFPDTRMLLQIHDELVFETPENLVLELQEFVKKRMEGAMNLRIPLVVEAAWAENWIDAK